MGRAMNHFALGPDGQILAYAIGLESNRRIADHRERNQQGQDRAREVVIHHTTKYALHGTKNAYRNLRVSIDGGRAC